MEQQTDNFREGFQESESAKLRNIANFINNRFRISPPFFADVFNPLLQANIGNGADRESTPPDENYSPTSPLNITWSDSSGSLGMDTDSDELTSAHPLVLALSAQPAMFSGKKKKEWGHRSCTFNGELLSLFRY